MIQLLGSSAPQLFSSSVEADTNNIAVCLRVTIRRLLNCLIHRNWSDGLLALRGTANYPSTNKAL